MSETKVWGVFGCPDFAYFQGVVFSSPDKARAWIDAQPDTARDVTNLAALYDVESRERCPLCGRGE